MSTPITARNTIQEWLDHPTGGPAIRGFLQQAGSSEESLGPALSLPLGKLVELSGGQLPREAVDQLVLAANGGVMPEEPADAEAPSAQRFAGRTVIVTGAAGGIGKAVAALLAAEGARVVATDFNGAGLEPLAAQFPEQIVTVPADLADPAAVEAILSAAGEQIDGLANVAGINDDFTAIHEVSDAMWDKVFAVNLTGMMRLTRAVTQRMLAAGRGSVVNVASEAGLRGSASGVAYTASKHAVIGLTKSSAFMYAKKGLRFNATAPGGVATGIAMQPTLGEFGSPRLEEVRNIMPGISLAEDQAQTIAFLLSDAASAINGAVLAVDGGWSAV